MSNLFDYLNENAQFQQLTQFGKQEKEAYQEKQAMGVTGLIETFPLAGDAYTKGKEIITKGKELYAKGQEAVEKLKESGQKIKGIVEDTVEKGKGVIEKGKGLGEEALQEGKGMLEKGKSMVGDLKGKLTNLSEESKTQLQGLQNRYDELKSQKIDIFSPEADELMKKIQVEKDSISSRIGDMLGSGEKDVNKFLDTGALKDKLNELKGMPKLEEVAPEVEKGVESLKSVVRTPVSSYNEAKGFIQRGVKSMSKKVFENEFNRDPESELSAEHLQPNVIEKVSSFIRQGYKEPIAQGSDALKSLATKSSGVLEKLQTGGENALKSATKGVEELGARATGLVSETGEKAASFASEIAGKASNIASKGASIATEAVAGATEAVEGIGSVVADTVPVVGELAALGVGLYDIIKNFGEKPHVYSVAKPTFASGL
jgi:hypothetical protein